MKIILLIAAAFLFDVILWVGLIAIIVRSDLELRWMLFAAVFGGCLIVILGGWIFQNLVMGNKKRHATLIDNRSHRFDRRNV